MLQRALHAAHLRIRQKYDEQFERGFGIIVVVTIISGSLLESVWPTLSIGSGILSIELPVGVIARGIRGRHPTPSFLPTAVDKTARAHYFSLLLSAKMSCQIAVKLV